MGARNPRLRFSAFNGANQAGVAAQFSLISVYNNSTARDFVVVHHFDFSIAAIGAGGFYLAEGQVGASVGGDQVVVPGEAQPAGVMQTTTIAALPGGRTHTLVGASLSYQWPHEYPVAVLLPGWSFVIYNGTVNVGLNASIWWEGVRADLYYQFMRDWEQP